MPCFIGPKRDIIPVAKILNTIFQQVKFASSRSATEKKTGDIYEYNHIHNMKFV